MARSVPSNVTNTVASLKTMTSRIKTRALIDSCSHMIGGVCSLTLSFISTAPGAVYRSIDGTCVANQIARLRDSRSLRYANHGYTLLAIFHYHYDTLCYT